MSLFVSAELLFFKCGVKRVLILVLFISSLVLFVDAL